MLKKLVQYKYFSNTANYCNIYYIRKQHALKCIFLEKVNITPCILLHLQPYPLAPRGLSNDTRWLMLLSPSWLYQNCFFVSSKVQCEFLCDSISQTKNRENPFFYKDVCQKGKHVLRGPSCSDHTGCSITEFKIIIWWVLPCYEYWSIRYII